MRLAAAVLTWFVATSAWCQVAKPPSTSRWNLLDEFSWRAPSCHDLQYFKGSPLLFDFKRELFGRKESDLRTTTRFKYIGVAHGYRVTQVLQHIDDVQAGIPLTAKRLLVRRGNHEFCAIYQQLYPDFLVTVRPASIIMFDGRPVLKTMDPNGNRTWNEQYWTFDASGPIHIELDNLYRRMQSVAPKGDEVFITPFDLSGICREAVVRKPGQCFECGGQDGTVAAKLAWRGSRLVATWVHWFPPGVEATCPN